MSKKSNRDPELDKILRRMWWRNIQLTSQYNWVRQMGHACTHVMRKFIEWLYPGPENREKRVEAMKRESVFYNITPAWNSLGIGLFAAMELEYKNNPDFDPKTINAIKVAIMGPASGLGDTIYWVTVRVILATIAIPFGLQGSILGLVIFWGGFVAIHWASLHFFGNLAFNTGTEFVTKAFKSGILQMLTKAASIVGFTMVGAMIAKTVSVPLNISFGVGEQMVTLASILDSIAPGILGLFLTLGCLMMVRKKIKQNLVLLIVLGLAIIGALIGLF